MDRDVIVRHELLLAMQRKAENIREALSEALNAPTGNESMGAMAPVWNDIADLKALADALVALRR